MPTIRESTKKLSSILKQDISECTKFNFAPSKNSSLILGITGPNGSGKSTLINKMAAFFLRQNKRVAVLAFDPTSPFSGGAILGDRIRLDSEDGIFLKHSQNFLFRSLGNLAAGHGVHPKVWLLLQSLLGDLFEVIIVESVGVGQTVFDLAPFVDLQICLVPPESGDEIQMLKAGLFEVVDVFAVSKSDLAQSALMESLLLQAWHEELDLRRMRNQTEQKLEEDPVLALNKKVWRFSVKSGQGLDDFFLALFELIPEQQKKNKRRNSAQIYFWKKFLAFQMAQKTEHLVEKFFQDYLPNKESKNFTNMYENMYNFVSKHFT